MEKKHLGKKPTRYTKPTLLQMLFVVGLVLIVGSLSYVFSPHGPISPLANVQPTPFPTPDVKQPKNVLLLGYGGGNHDGGLLTDTIIVARIIPKEKKIVLISIPRDAWITLPLSESESLETKINAAYAIGNDDDDYPNKDSRYRGKAGGGNLAKDAVSQIINMPVDAYAAISFSGFIDAMNIFSPLTVEVPFRFTDSFYPITGKETENCGKSEDDIRTLTATMSGFELEKQFPCRYETITFSPGKQQMDAQTALKFVRSRHSDQYGTDFGRSQRQQALLRAIKESVFSLGTIPKIIPILQKGFSIIDTDISIDLVRHALQVWGNFSDYTVSSLALTDENVLVSAVADNGQYILQPKTGAGDWKSVATFIEQEIASASAVVTPSR